MGALRIRLSARARVRRHHRGNECRPCVKRESQLGMSSAYVERAVARMSGTAESRT